MYNKAIILNSLKMRLMSDLPKVMQEDRVNPTIEACLKLVGDAVDNAPKKNECGLCGEEKPTAERMSTDPRNPQKVRVCRECMSKYFSVSMFEIYEYT